MINIEAFKFQTFISRQQEETCRHCKHWNNFHIEGNPCEVWHDGPLNDNRCGCPKWESNDNLKYLEEMSKNVYR